MKFTIKHNIEILILKSMLLKWLDFHSFAMYQNWSFVTRVQFDNKKYSVCYPF